MGSSVADTIVGASRWIVAHPYDLRKGINTDEFDIVIVGGGTAGCVLAARLSENLSITVCLLEAGESSLSLPLSRVPSGYSRFFGSDYLYNFQTTRQAHAADLERYWPRAKMLGGCSAINAGIFHCCSPSDYDEWGRTGLDGASRWSYATLRKYFLRFEKFSPSKAHPRVDASLRGSRGPIETGFFSYFSAITSAFMDACSNAGVPSKSDFNTPEGTLGVGKFMTYINAKGERVSTQSAYLTPEVLKRKNLAVLAHASVTKVLVESAGAHAVEVSPEQNTTYRIIIKARKEVVLCAGAVHTPQILMLSGIGPAEQLRTHGIPVIADLPGVGAHLMDHPVVDAVFKETGGNSLFFLKPRGRVQTMRTFFTLGQYLLTGRGPLSTNWMEAAAFFRSSDLALFPAADFPLQIEDSTSGPDAPDLELTVTPVGYTDHGRTRLANTPSLGLHIVLLRPKSLGTVKLGSASPFDPPIIDPQYLSSPNDLNVIFRGMKMLARVADTAPLSNIIRKDNRDPSFGLDLTNASDDELVGYARSKLESLYHPTSTARMALPEDGGVVDSQLRVHGVKKLRIVDASIFPTIPSGHPSAATIAVAEMAADMILDKTC
ncbi:alcohol oxidase [Mycena vitilis]|nr:alcohol oxidase [Mycena vitilis]